MDQLREDAMEFSKLFNKDFIYKLDGNQEIKLIFVPGHFHHLMGLKKLTDIDKVIKSPKNSVNYIFENIYKGFITLDEIKKSSFFDEIEPRLRHFKQINRIVESADIIYEFDPALIKSEKLKAGSILFRMSNDNMYLNLLIKIDDARGNFHVPYTFIPRVSDDYTRGQKSTNIQSITVEGRPVKKK